ncbi:hypothetical protein ACFQ1S_32935, partial [Kibdelosporangium lantanae]
MADPKGFLTTPRENATTRPVFLRLKDWREVYEEFGPGKVSRQAGRCMDCGIPFCHQGCPLGNLIPEWNTLVWRDDWEQAAARLHATNNFPEFTGTLCPAPCETACVVGINGDPVTIKRVEISIIDRAFDVHLGLVAPAEVTAVVHVGVFDGAGRCVVDRGRHQHRHLAVLLDRQGRQRVDADLDAP